MQSRKMLVSLLTATILAGCDRAANEGIARSSEAPAAAAANAKPDKCVDGLAIHVGDTNIQLQLLDKDLLDTDLHWSTSGPFLTLTSQGNGKDVELVASKNIGGPSLPKGDCLRSGNYIRLASTRQGEPSRYLLAYQAMDPNRVPIGRYGEQQPEPEFNSIHSIFNVVKAPGGSNSAGAIIRRGDVIVIRGVSRDPWLRAPDSPTEGSLVGLVNWDRFDDASRWKIQRHGPPVDAD